MSKNEKLAALNAATAATLSTSVPLDLHPDSVVMHGDKLVINGGPGEVAYVAGRQALRSMYDSLVEIERAATAQLVPVAVGKEGRTRMEIPPERRANLASAMTVRFENAATSVARNEAAIGEAIDQLSQRINSATAHPNRERASVVQTASEIRGHIKGLESSSKRMEFVRGAIADGDLEIAAAVLQTSCYSSGFSKSEFAVIRSMAEDRFAPNESSQRTAALAVKRQVELAQGSFLTRYLKLVPRLAPSAADLALNRLRETATAGKGA